MDKKYYVIAWNADFNRWVRTHPNGMTLDAAKHFGRDMPQRTNVIHEMWLDCLEEWPEPGYFAQCHSTEHTRGINE